VPSRARVIALLAALLMTLPAGAWARSRYFCRAMDRVMDACCCGSMRTVEPLQRSVSVSAVQTAELRSGDCCERLEQPSAKVALGARDADQHSPAPLALALLPLAAPPGLPSGWLLPLERPHSRAPPSPAVPLYLRHCAFLS
jgi:hypothetical protein